MSEPEGPPAGLTVLYADADLIAVDKPAGLHTAPLGRETEDTLLGRLIERFPEVARLPGHKRIEPGLLHRLDRDTSGLVLVARTPEAFYRLAADFAAGRVRKEYVALCAPTSNVRDRQRFVLESRFAPFGPGRRKVRVVPAGRTAARAGRKTSPRLYRTEAEVLSVCGRFAMVQAAILRGFRHQVRAHLSHLGLPLVGDALYGVPAPPGTCDRLYLHASAVKLALPSRGGMTRIHSPLPPEFLSWYGIDGRGTQ